MYTRKQRLNNECTHEEYYNQFVNDAVLYRVEQFIGIDSIKKSEDPSFNDIPLKKWDALGTLPRSASDKMKEAGDYPTKAGAVCTYKAAARIIKNQN